MKRRHFLTTAATVPILLNGFSVRALANGPLVEGILAGSGCEDHILVLIQLAGGNDGLNTVIPLDQYPAYTSARANIAIAENTVLKLNNETGLHPKLAGLHSLYNNGKVRVIQSVGYPTPDYSHFRSTDIWMSASNYDEYVDTGWLGRFLEEEYPGFPIGYPNGKMPHPVAIQIGNQTNLTTEGATANLSMAFSDPTKFSNIVDFTDSTTGSRAQQEIKFLRRVGQNIQSFATPVRDAASKAKNKSTKYPTTVGANVLADQLKIVAQLIAGGLQTRVYMVTLGGFDTHTSQNTGGNGQAVSHPVLLDQLSVAIDAFQDDLQLLGVADRVLGMTFSEFGRRMKSNSSNGTDHGAAAPVFLFGNPVTPGILGNNPTIPTTVTANDNVPMQYDFRSLYASILKNWFCAPDDQVKRILLRDFNQIPILKNTVNSAEELDGMNSARVTVYPNPVSSNARVQLETQGGYTRIALFNGEGKELFVVMEGDVKSNTLDIPLEVSELSSGNYYLRVQTGKAQILEHVVVLR